MPPPAALAQASAGPGSARASGITVTVALVARRALDELASPRRRSPWSRPSGRKQFRRRAAWASAGVTAENGRQVAADLLRTDAAQHVAGDQRRRPRRSSRCCGRNCRSATARRAVELGRRDRLGAEPPHLRRGSARAPRRRHRCGSGSTATNGPGRAAGVDAAAGAIGQAAADADLLVEPRAVAAAEHRIGDDRAIIARIARERSRCARPRPPPGPRPACRRRSRRCARGAARRRCRVAAAAAGAGQLAEMPLGERAAPAPASMSPDRIRVALPGIQVRAIGGLDVGAA